MRPEPEIIYEIPTPLWMRALHMTRRVVRETREAVAFVREVYRRREISTSEAMMFARAAYDAATGGQTVEREDFIWKARNRAYGERGARKVERSGTAYVQRRGPAYHDTVKA